jgi:hypothetical protein
MRTYVLVNTEMGREGSVAEAVRSLSEVTAVHCISGPYDLIAECESVGHGRLIRETVEPIRSTPGVLRVVVCPQARAKSEIERQPAFAA